MVCFSIRTGQYFFFCQVVFPFFQDDFKCTPFSRFTFYLNTSLMLLYYSMADGESQPCSLSNGFGGVKWVKYSRKIGLGNIGATNVLRTGSKKAAVLTLLLDGGKGADAAGRREG